MIVYCVTISIDSDIAEQWLDWMREVHIPDVLRTNCFRKHQIMAQLSDETEPRARFLIQYFCDSEEVLGRYWAEDAPGLQAAHTQRYHGRFEASRTVFRRIQD
jgi:hypothetical protein